MKVLFNVDHPAKFHLFKNAMKILKDRGNEVILTIVDKEVTLNLAEKFCKHYTIDYKLIGRNSGNLTKKAFNVPSIEFNLLKTALNFKPDLLVGGCGDPYVAHVSKMINRPSFIFDTNDQAKLQHKLSFPFATRIFTPSSYLLNLGKKHTKYEGFHELAYLHPDYFKPDNAILDYLNLPKNDIILLRLVSWNAFHDVGKKSGNILEYLSELEKYGTVVISSESKLTSEFDKYCIPLPPERLHDVLYYSKMALGEGATTASECTILGTQSIYTNPIKLGYIKELETKYGLINLSNTELTLKHMLDMLENNSLKKQSMDIRKKILDEKIDVTKFICNGIENYETDSVEY
ncbi:hypothetical protein HNP93_001527 [Methanococcus maripaludis]|uniref:DUF354 domain-containing protein n=1 Tax=Methanococcus maripaludis TaxID=39152 RepID=A0A7J9P7X5_METMI|nr:DUF354 domain-containing protein [Methanococcus maripaludis]MBA2858826.1 hypothetical protein [Methanococcus maripaludis]